MNALVKQSVEKCEELMDQGHVSTDIKLVLKDLMAVIKNMDALVSENSHMSADKRYKEKTYNQERREKQKLEKSFEQLKTVIIQDLPPVFKDLSIQVQAVMHQGQRLQSPELIQSGEKMKASLRQLIEVMASAGKEQA